MPQMHENWYGFKPATWTTAVNVRSFIKHNYTPYDGDESFLAGPTRNTLDLSAIPMLRQMSHLPIVIDPSHATGISKLVKPMSVAAAAAGADGLMIEVHNNPQRALCDGAQSLTPEQFRDTAQAVKRVLKAIKGEI